MAKDARVYSAFIDLLATKQSLDIGNDAYHTALRQFRQAIRNNVNVLRDRDKIHVFSDCAYVSVSDLARFHRFVTALRADLLIERLFFRGAVVDGPLGAEDFARTIADQSQGRKVTGHIFGPNAVRAFQLHEQTKGVAVVAEANFEDSSTLLVRSAFTDTDKNETIRSILDFKFLFDDVEHENQSLDRLCKETKKQNTRSRRIGRYYLTPFLTWINSTSFSGLSYDATERSFSGRRPIIERLMDPKTFQDIKTLASHEHIYYALAQKLRSDKAHESAVHRVFDFISVRQNLRERIGRASTRIITEAVKNELLNYLTD